MGVGTRIRSSSWPIMGRHSPTGRLPRSHSGDREGAHRRGRRGAGCAAKEVQINQIAAGSVRDDDPMAALPSVEPPQQNNGRITRSTTISPVARWLWVPSDQGVPRLPKEIDALVPEEPDVHDVMDIHATSRDHRRQDNHTGMSASRQLRPPGPIRSRAGSPNRGTTTARGRPCFRRVTRSGYPRLHRKAQTRPETLQADEIHWRHPQRRQALTPPGQP